MFWGHRLAALLRPLVIQSVVNAGESFAGRPQGLLEQTGLMS